MFRGTRQCGDVRRISKSQVLHLVQTRTWLHIDLIELVCSQFFLRSLFSSWPLLPVWDVCRLLFNFWNVPMRRADSFLQPGIKEVEELLKIFKSGLISRCHVWRRSTNVLQNLPWNFTVAFDIKWRRISPVVLTTFRSLYSYSGAAASKLSIQA